jgi:hypothetical protein
LTSKRSLPVVVGNVLEGLALVDAQVVDQEVDGREAT